MVVTMTTPVEPTTLFLSGQLTFPNSTLTSLINCLVLSKNFIFLGKIPSLVILTAIVMIGRPGGTRTPNTRFWRPALYQLELLAYIPSLD